MKIDTAGPALIGALFLCLFTTTTLAEPIPQDSNRYLTFFNSGSPAHEETLETTHTCYQPVGPDNFKTTLNDWLTASGFATGIIIDATFVNDANLGVGRIMVMKVPDSGRVACCVAKYFDNTPLGVPVDGHAEGKIAHVQLARILSLLSPLNSRTWRAF